jgi:hypothetical protein
MYCLHATLEYNKLSAMCWPEANCETKCRETICAPVSGSIPPKVAYLSSAKIAGESSSQIHSH